MNRLPTLYGIIAILLWSMSVALTRGLSETVRQSFSPEQGLKLPMLPGQRSLNLSNAVAVTVFEAWRQNGFGAAGR